MAEGVSARAFSLVGATIGTKYRIERLLGVGGMAAVYAAVHRNGRRVAIKLLHGELAMRPDMRERFIREGLAANAVDHPGVVAVIDDDVTADGSPFLVMELLNGESIAELWQKHDFVLPPRMVLTIASELCDVLSVAHKRGVIHRDIKPANLFLTHDGRVKVLDFGIASLREMGVSQLTEHGMMMGTPSFLPPEQASGRISQVDHRSDLWAAGALMFSLLAGRLVHEGESGQHIAVLAATQPAPSLATVQPDMHPAVVAIVDRALKLDRQDRWQSAEAMRIAILNALQQLPPDGPPRPTTGRRSPLLRTSAGTAATTSHAVSSSSPAEAAGWRTTQKLARLFKTVRLMVTGNQMAPTVPMAMTPDLAPPPRSRKIISITALALAVSAITAFAIVTVRRTTATRTLATASPSEPPAISAPETPLRSSAAFPASPPSPSLSLPSAPTIASSLPPHAPPATPSGPRPTVRSTTKKTTTPNCTPPYVVDPATGKTTWKTECL